MDDLLGHAILIIVYHLLSHDDEVYQDLGVQHFDESRRERVQRGLVQRLKDLGYQVTSNLLNLAHTPPDGGVVSFSQHIYGAVAARFATQRHIVTARTRGPR